MNLNCVQKNICDYYQIHKYGHAFHLFLKVRIPKHINEKCAYDIYIHLLNSFPILRSLVNISKYQYQIDEQIDNNKTTFIKCADTNDLSHKQTDCIFCFNFEKYLFNGYFSNDSLLLLFNHMFIDGKSIELINEFIKSSFDTNNTKSDTTLDTFKYSEYKFNYPHTSIQNVNSMYITNVKKQTINNFSGNHRTITIKTLDPKSIDQFCEENQVTTHTFYFSVCVIALSRYCNIDDDLIIGDMYHGRPKDFTNTIGMFCFAAPILIKRKYFDSSVQFFFKKIEKSISKNIKTYNEGKINILINDVRNLNYFKESIISQYDGDGIFDLEIKIIDSTELLIKYSNDYEVLIDSIEKTLQNEFVNIIEQNDFSLRIDNRLNCITFDIQKNDSFIKGETTELLKQNIYNLLDMNISSNNAIVMNKKSISYFEMKTKTDSIASYIQSKNLYQQTICISIDKSIELILLMLGIMKSGNIYVPLDKKLPDVRKDYILKDTGCKLLITDEANKPNQITESLETLLIEDFDKNITTKYITLTDNFPKYAYIIYTSGSTGVPKGIPITHLSMTNAINNYCKLLGKVNSCFSSSISWDTQFREIFVPLVSGKTVYIVDTLLDDIPPEVEWINGTPSIIGEMKQLSTVIKINEDQIYKKDNDVIITAKYGKADTYKDVTQIVKQKLLTDGYVKACNNNFSDVKIGVVKELIIHKSRIKIITLAGESLNRKCWDNIKTFDNIYTFYGPTECCQASTYHKINEFSRKIGKPFPNVEVYVINNFKICPIGEIGELCIGGIGLSSSSGYLNNFRLTKEKYVYLNHDPNKILYLTGDLAKMNSDGTLEFIGRNDNQIKKNGIRIELGEIESWLQKYPGILNAVVLFDSNVIKAFITKDDQIKDNDQIKKYLREKLPEYMIPATLISLKDFPLLLNGKIDRNKLLESTKIIIPSYFEKKEAEQYVITKEFNKKCNLNTEIAICCYKYDVFTDKKQLCLYVDESFDIYKHFKQIKNILNPYWIINISKKYHGLSNDLLPNPSYNETLSNIEEEYIVKNNANYESTILEKVEKIVSDILCLHSIFDYDRPLTHYGLDSLKHILLKKIFMQIFNVEITTTEYTINDIVKFINITARVKCCNFHKNNKYRNINSLVVLFKGAADKFGALLEQNDKPKEILYDLKTDFLIVTNYLFLKNTLFHDVCYQNEIAFVARKYERVYFMSNSAGGHTLFFLAHMADKCIISGGNFVPYVNDIKSGKPGDVTKKVIDNIQSKNDCMYYLCGNTDDYDKINIVTTINDSIKIKHIVVKPFSDENTHTVFVKDNKIDVYKQYIGEIFDLL
jgi:acyl-coenzyme A synthetase/AMP-(fatty) acid ligase